MNFPVLFLLVALVISALPTAKSHPRLAYAAIHSSQGKLTVAPGPVEIPFELVNRHVILKVRVDGSRPLSFVLDTGDRFAIVDLDRAKELGLKLNGEIEIGGAGTARQTGAFVQGSSFTIPGFDGFSQPLRLAIPMSNLAAGLGHDFDGIIGFDFIKEFVLELDYLARVIRLHPKDSFTYSGPGEMIPIDLDASRHAAGHPIMEAEVTPLGGSPIKGKYVLDIGSSLALALYSPFVNKHRLPGPERKTIRAFGAGAGGEIKARLGRVAELKFGKFRISNPLTLFSEDEAGAFADPSLAGNIGAQIASKFKIFFDYSHSRIILEPNLTFAEVFERASSGLRIHGEGAGHRTFRVKNVLENSPASEAGVLKDDIISTIDGQPTANLTLTSLNEMLERPVSYKLTVQRGGQVLTLTLTPRKLV